MIEIILAILIALLIWKGVGALSDKRDQTRTPEEHLARHKAVHDAIQKARYGQPTDWRGLARFLLWTAAGFLAILIVIALALTVHFPG